MKDKIIEILGKERSLDSMAQSRLDFFIECIESNSPIHSLDYVLSWVENLKSNFDSTVESIPLNDVLDDGDWILDDFTGNLKHTSGGFFEIIGVDVKTNIRESGKGWKQPMMDQGTESSVAGIIKKKIKGNFHYLLEGKFEPGNYGSVQLSPTLQVTYSNLNKLHGGQKPRFTEYFDNTKKVKILYDCWLPEDGGRFFKKRVKNMLVEIPENEEINAPSNFIWLTMNQIKELLKHENLINTHVRSIISHL